jgi:hypothetical protein
MRWKEILIGAAMTLMVTVIGGLLVYKFTQTSNINREESLFYDVDKQVAFEGASNNVSIGSAKIANTGGQAAKNVTAVFKILDSNFMEFKANSSSGGDQSTKISDDKKTVMLSVKSLLPGEIINTAFLLSKEAKVDVQLRSDNSIGKAGQTYRVENTKKDKINRFLGDFVPLLIVMTMLPLLFIIKYIRNSAYGYSKNNVGFVLLHSGLNKEANEILNAAVRNGEGGSLAISNYALTLAINNNIVDAQKYIVAAGFLARGKLDRAVIKFNFAIISFLGGNEKITIQYLNESIQLSKREILNYCKYSVHIKDIMNKCNDVKTLIESA